MKSYRGLGPLKTEEQEEAAQEAFECWSHAKEGSFLWCYARFLRASLAHNTKAENAAIVAMVEVACPENHTITETFCNIGKIAFIIITRIEDNTLPNGAQLLERVIAQAEATNPSEEEEEVIEHFKKKLARALEKGRGGLTYAQEERFRGIQEKKNRMLNGMCQYREKLQALICKHAWECGISQTEIEVVENLYGLNGKKCITVSQISELLNLRKVVISLNIKSFWDKLQTVNDDQNIRHILTNMIKSMPGKYRQSSE